MAEFLDRFESAARLNSQSVAFILDGDSISLGDVNSYANRFANWLLTDSRTTGEVVGVCMEPSLLTGALVVGILKAGKAFLGLDPGYPAARLRYMAAQGNCSLVVTDETIASNRFGSARVLTVLELTELIRDRSDFNPERISVGDAPAYLTFTSGSTGSPKAVLAPTSQVDNRLAWMWESYPFGRGEVCCQRMPLSVIDSVWEILGPIAAAIPVALIPAKRYRSSASLVDELYRHGVTRLWMLPAAINDLVETFPDLGKRLPKLWFWVSTGDTLSPGLVAKLQKAVPLGRLFNLYGTSEVWDATWYEVPTDGVEGPFVPIGKAITNVDVCVIDESARVVADGECGEIAVGGKGVALGYMIGGQVVRESLCTEVVGRGEGYYRTGDLGRIAADGNLVFLGRRKSTINRGHAPIRLIEVEAALTLHPAVSEGAIGVCREGSRDVITAYYRVRPGWKMREPELWSFLSEYLCGTSLPDRLVRLTCFPMTPSGKIDRMRLTDWENSGEANPTFR